MKIDEIHTNSEQIREILEKYPSWILKWGITVIFITICCFILSSWFLKYPDIILSEAVITTQIPPQKEYAKTTGKLTAILVKDNDIITAKQPLAIIENTANHNDVFKLKAIIDTIKVNTTSFSFPIDSLPMLFLGDIESQYALFENSYIQYQMNKELDPFLNEETANKYSITELKTRLKNVEYQKEISKTELNFKTKDLKRYNDLFEKGVISAQEYENKELEYAQIQRNYTNFESSISQIRESMSDATKISKGIKINRVREEMTLLKNVIQSFNQLKRAIKDWEYQYVMRSDINGKVSFLNFWSLNQTINQGDLVFTIIPTKNSSFIAKLKAPLQNSGKIKIGQKVNIKLDNYPYTEYGILQGTVRSISQIPDTKDTYFVSVKLPNKLSTSYHKNIRFTQEMRGTAEIITEDLRLIERLFYQFKKIFDR